MVIILTNNQPRSDSNMPPFWGELLCNQDVLDIKMKPDHNSAWHFKIVKNKRKRIKMNLVIQFVSKVFS
jgi:hypothetical protein